MVTGAGRKRSCRPLGRAGGAGFRAWKERRPSVRSDEVTLRLLEQDQLFAALPTDSPLAEKGTFEIADLALQNFIGYPAIQ